MSRRITSHELGFALIRLRMYFCLGSRVFMRSALVLRRTSGTCVFGFMAQNCTSFV
jgi:hypothetical protein